MAEDQDAELEITIPPTLPVLPVNAVVFPYMLVPLATEAEDAALVDAVVSQDRLLALAARRLTEDPLSQEGLGVYQIGCAARVQRMLQMPDGTHRLLVRGLSRVRLVETTQTEPYTRSKVEPLPEMEEKSDEIDGLAQALLQNFEQIVNLSTALPDEAYLQALNMPTRGGLCDLVAAALNTPVPDKQRILEAVSLHERLHLVNEAAYQELTRLQIADQASTEFRQEMESTQREHFLRQQLQAIQRELGEAEESDEIQELRQRLESAEMSEPAREAAEHELGRLARMNPAAAEYSVIRTYLDWLLELPWLKCSAEHIEVAEAQEVLDTDHYDLTDVKDRIVEYLAVRKIKPDIKGPILCFVGPPGVGKTSLGRSIARAMGREFVRVSLGGIRDEAEIRGHRRTYVGALPGRIIQGIRNAGTCNPVFMLDEIDKVGADFRGDPTSALLEVLDPEQNDTFSDHYLEVPFDLSRVVFVTTANVLATIPPPLLDRMEVLHLPGYTDEEKMEIARRYLIPRQAEEHGLKRSQVKVSDAALRLIIRGYTREAGVRNLERNLATLCRKQARRLAGGETRLPGVTVKNLEEFLGPRPFYSEVAERINTPGVVCGLAWTQAGGEILFVEATKMPGRESLVLTGQLGEVMQESARAALSWVRSNAEKLGLAPDFFSGTDVHLHVPAGATPKDGPSAGSAMAMALTSLLTGRLARSDVAMTGEITLRGKVLRIGGVKEKVLAAKRAGITTVILPRDNQSDVREMEEPMVEGMKFVYVDTVDQVIEQALEPKKASGQGSGRQSKK
ncbi:MAG: endopeptidase La [candidate division WS1 bacterium]|nr:endopeptidase La [candidate division WS1 bacterium]